MSKEVNEERASRTVEDVKEMLAKHSNGEIQRTIQNCITILQNDYVLFCVSPFWKYPVTLPLFSLAIIL